MNSNKNNKPSLEIIEKLNKSIELENKEKCELQSKFTILVLKSLSCFFISLILFFTSTLFITTSVLFIMSLIYFYMMIKNTQKLKQKVSILLILKKTQEIMVKERYNIEHNLHIPKFLQ